MDTATFTTASALAQNPGATNAIKTASAIAATLPPPWGPVAAIVLNLIGEGYAAIAAYRNDVLCTALATLPKNYADAAMGKLQFGPSDFVDALQSFIAYRSIGSGVKEIAFRQLRDSTGISNSNRSTLANKVRKAVLAVGAPQWMADHAAYTAVWVESRRDWSLAADESDGKKWRAAVLSGYPAGTLESAAFADRLAKWQQGKGQIGAVVTSKEGVPWLLIAGGAALLLAFRGRR